MSWIESLLTVLALGAMNKPPISSQNLFKMCCVNSETFVRLSVEAFRWYQTKWNFEFLFSRPGDRASQCTVPPHRIYSQRFNL